MNPLSKGFELFSFEFSLPQSSSTSIECPNCGYQIYSNIFQKVNISKTFILICCGSIVYWNLIKDQNSRISLILSSTKNLIQNGITNLFLSLTPPSPSSPNFDEKFIVDQTTTNIFNQCSSSSNYSVVNQLIVNNSNNNNDEHCSLSSQNDYSSINLSPLNSIGNGTLAKLEGMLDDVEQIKMYVNDSCNEIGWYTTGVGGSDGQQRNQTEFLNILQRRLSDDGEITASLPSLEWDLNDINFDSNHDNESIDDGQSSVNLDFDEIIVEQNSEQRNSSNTINENHQNFIDNETLSQIIFNKNFQFKDEQFFRSKKQFINLKQRLKFLTKSQQQQRNHRFNNGNHRFNNNINSNNYRSNRDSAFFEDL